MCNDQTDADRAQKHGMDEFISANPCNFDHASLFEMVQRLTLDHRLNDSYSCLASRKNPVLIHCLHCVLGLWLGVNAKTPGMFNLS